MEKKLVKSLSNEAKTIKVMGQGCLDDCSHKELISGQTYPIPAVGGCMETRCTYRTWKDAHFTSEF